MNQKKIVTMEEENFELGKFYFAIQERKVLGTLCTLAERVVYVGENNFMTRENEVKHKNNYKIIYEY